MPKMLFSSARSSVFGRMLANKDCNEYKQSLLKIVDVSEDIFELFIEFLYTDRIPNLSLTQATDVLIVADKYDVKKLKQMCDNMLVTILKATDPVHDVFQLAHALNCSHELKKKAFGFVKSLVFSKVYFVSSRFNLFNFFQDYFRLVSRQGNSE